MIKSHQNFISSRSSCLRCLQILTEAAAKNYFSDARVVHYWEHALNYSDDQRFMISKRSSGIFSIATDLQTDRLGSGEGCLEFIELMSSYMLFTFRNSMCKLKAF